MAKRAECLRLGVLIWIFGEMGLPEMDGNGEALNEVGKGFCGEVLKEQKRADLQVGLKGFL